MVNTSSWKDCGLDGHGDPSFVLPQLAGDMLSEPEFGGDGYCGRMSGILLSRIAVRTLCISRDTKFNACKHLNFPVKNHFDRCLLVELSVCNTFSTININIYLNYDLNVVHQILSNQKISMQYFIFWLLILMIISNKLRLNCKSNLKTFWFMEKILSLCMV